jgi:hypothetical protein
MRFGVVFLDHLAWFVVRQQEIDGPSFWGDDTETRP